MAGLEDFLTWSWWSKKVLTHTLEFVSHTFTLLSDELNTKPGTDFRTTFAKVSTGIYGIYTLIKQEAALQWKSDVSPGDKVGVVGGEGDAEDPGGMATERARQVGVLSAKHGEKKSNNLRLPSRAISDKNNSLEFPMDPKTEKPRVGKASVFM